MTDSKQQTALASTPPSADHDASSTRPGSWYTAPPPRHSWGRWAVFLILTIIVVIGLGFLTKVVLAINSTNDSSGNRVSFFEQIRHLIDNPEDQLRGEADDRINILLAGIGGAGHQGAYLADTIIVVSIKPSTHEVATLSIPRDLYVEIPEYGWRKINNSLAFGEASDYPGGGEALLVKTLEPIIGQTLNYYVRVDFEGFRKIIDDLGGIDVDIDNSFTDYEYPDYNYGYQTISFTKGWEHMDGERALQYSRSRHGTNGEGSDFARSARQQKVLFAVKNKALSLNTILNPNKIVKALESLGDHNKTNMEIWEIVRLANMIEKVNQDNLISRVLENSPEGLLQSETTIDGAYILRPRSGDYTAIQKLFNNIFQVDEVVKESAAIAVQNSTTQEGLAGRTADWLENMNYTINQVSNANIETPLPRTTIYDLSGGTNPYTIASLQETLNAEVALAPPDFWLNDQTNTNTADKPVDILIVLGKDFQLLTGRATSQ